MCICLPGLVFVSMNVLGMTGTGLNNMHEVSLCRQIIDILTEQSRQSQFTSIKVVYLELGELSCVDKSALQFAFGALAKGTVAADARLEFIDVPGQAYCAACQQAFHVKQLAEPCPRCQAFSAQIIQGQDIRVKEIQV
jgi:hydrogenase nickel incorporation protein HypA/HybF